MRWHSDDKQSLAPVMPKLKVSVLQLTPLIKRNFSQLVKQLNHKPFNETLFFVSITATLKPLNETYKYCWNNCKI